MGLVAYVQYLLNIDGNDELFTYEGKNLTSYISALLLITSISVCTKFYAIMFLAVYS